MNQKEKQAIRDIKDAKRFIENAKRQHSSSTTNMNTLASFIESYVKVDSLKNIRSDIKLYQNKMSKNNEQLDRILKSLDTDIKSIEKEAAQREAAEKKRLEEEKRKREEEKRREEEAKKQAQGV